MFGRDEAVEIGYFLLSWANDKWTSSVSIPHPCTQLCPLDTITDLHSQEINVSVALNLVSCCRLWRLWNTCTANCQWSTEVRDSNSLLFFFFSFFFLLFFPPHMKSSSEIPLNVSSFLPCPYSSSLPQLFIISII